jgi:hypothetical protein
MKSCILKNMALSVLVRPSVRPHSVTARSQLTVYAKQNESRNWTTYYSTGRRVDQTLQAAAHPSNGITHGREACISDRAHCAKESVYGHFLCLVQVVGY